MSDEQPAQPDPRLTRRQTLGIAGAAGSAVVLGGGAGKVISGLVEDPDEVTAAAAKSCKLTPEAEEGPFYVALDKIRRDITDGKPGVPLTLRMRVIDTKRCRPIRNAAVDIWHADAGGTYSDESSEGTLGQTYLRGVQLTNKKGRVTFETVYPGHYEGRATHIHIKVHIGAKSAGGAIRGGHVAHTGQVFADDSISSAVYALSPYNSSTVARVLNGNDRVYTQQGGSQTLMSVKGSAQGVYVGSIALGVRPKATPATV